MLAFCVGFGQPQATLSKSLAGQATGQEEPCAGFLRLTLSVGLGMSQKEHITWDRLAQGSGLTSVTRSCLNHTFQARSAWLHLYTPVLGSQLPCRPPLPAGSWPSSEILLPGARRPT